MNIIKNTIKKIIDKMNKYITNDYILSGFTILLVVFILFLILNVFLFNFNLKSNSSVMVNEVGTSLVGLIAFFAAFKAYHTQKSQLEDNRKQDSKLRVETQFFHLISLHNGIVDSLKVNYLGETYEGRDYFKCIFEQKLTSYYNEFSDEYDNNVRFIAMFNKIQKEEDQLYYYFRNLYQVFKCIHKQRSSNVITEDEQNEYIEYIDAQLSKRERHLLYFNVHFFNEHNKQKENTFKEILSDFNFFEKHNFSGEKIEQEFIEETKKKTRNM